MVNTVDKVDNVDTIDTVDTVDNVDNVDTVDKLTTLKLLTSHFLLTLLRQFEMIILMDSEVILQSQFGELWTEQ